MNKKYTFLRAFILQILIIFLSVPVILAQDGDQESLKGFEAKYHNWYNLDARADKVPGVSVDRAYRELLRDKKPTKKIVVAVIDSGTDIDHEDLKGRVWING